MVNIMKFECDFGLNEIVSTDSKSKLKSDIFKIVSITFALDSKPVIAARDCNGFIHGFSFSELEGDPDFNQEAGCYPEDPGDSEDS